MVSMEGFFILNDKTIIIKNLKNEDSSWPSIYSTEGKIKIFMMTGNLSYLIFN